MILEKCEMGCILQTEERQRLTLLVAEPGDLKMQPEET